MSSDEPVTLNLSVLRSVGIKNLVNVENYFINRLMGSVPHQVMFWGGGELRFAYNSTGDLIELHAVGLSVELRLGQVIFDVAER